jgi:hypothetical protein
MDNGVHSITTGFHKPRKPQSKKPLFDDLAVCCLSISRHWRGPAKVFAWEASSIRQSCILGVSHSMSSSSHSHQRSSSTFEKEYSGVVGLYFYLEQVKKWTPPCLGRTVPFLARNLSYKREGYEEERRKLNGCFTDHVVDGGQSAPNGERQRRSTAGHISSQSKDDEDSWPSMRSPGHTSRTAVIYKFRYSGGLQER